MGHTKTKLQKKFEEQTPTIKGVQPIEYLHTFITWLEFQIEKKDEEIRILNKYE